MTTAEAREILQAMLDGADPVTGEILSAEHICNYPEVIRALHIAIASISDDWHSPAKVHKNSRLNAGRPGSPAIAPNWSPFSNPAPPWTKCAGSFSAADGA